MSVAVDHPQEVADGHLLPDRSIGTPAQGQHQVAPDGSRELRKDIQGNPGEVSLHGATVGGRSLEALVVMDGSEKLLF